MTGENILVFILFSFRQIIMLLKISSNIGNGQSTDKRVAARLLIEQYYFQLTRGCGNENCNNEHCASSKKVINLTPNQAAAQVVVKKKTFS